MINVFIIYYEYKYQNIYEWSFMWSVSGQYYPFAFPDSVTLVIFSLNQFAFRWDILL